MAADGSPVRVATLVLAVRRRVNGDEAAVSSNDDALCLSSMLSAPIAVHNCLMPSLPEVSSRDKVVAGAIVGVLIGTWLSTVKSMVVLSAAAETQAAASREHVEVVRVASEVARSTAEAAEAQAQRLVRATWVLAAATGGLFLATLVLVAVGVGNGH
jgi:hypothetical protein